MNPHTKKHSSHNPDGRNTWVTVIVLCLIFFAIFIGLFIITSERETISSTAETVRLRMNRNMSPLASEHITDGVINSQLFGRDRADLYTGSGRDAVVTSREFLDNYLPPNVRRSLRPRGNISPGNDRNHVIYQQYVDDLPVYGSHVSVHLEGGSNVRGVTASVARDTALEAAKLSEQVAADMALKSVRRDYPDIKSWRVGLTEKLVFNGELRGFSEDPRNVPAVLVNLQAGNDDDTGGLVYIVSLIDGAIVDRYSEAIEVRQRTIFNCPTFDPARPSTVICNQSRTEGAPALGISEADEAYDSFGTVYETFDSVLGSKSYDNADGTLIGRVNLSGELTRSDGSKPCAKGNAWWNTGSKSMFYCAGWVSLDISAHEIGHGVVFAHIPNMGKNFQSGAVNEGVADMFGMLVDGDDWNMGDESPVGIIRHLDDPTKGKRPDRIHSEFFGCIVNDGSASSSNDFGYIHKNATVIGKWFYLLAEGGTFNGCTVPGIGRQKAMKIVYESLSGGYLIPTANFKNFFDAALAACADLFGADSPECQSANTAGLATELDQQSATSQNGPKCMGTEPKVPLCGVIATATTTPSGCTNKAQGDADCNGTVSVTDYAVWRTEYKGGCSSTTPTTAACGDDKDADGSLMDADFGGDNKVSLADYQVWRANIN